MACLALAFALAYGPTFHGLVHGLWGNDDHAHGPIVAALASWLIWRGWQTPVDMVQSRAIRLLGWALVVLGLLAQVLGRAFGVLAMEVGSLLLAVTGVTLLIGGRARLRATAFGIFFLFFLVPLPGAVIDALTMPMKLAVSAVSESVLHLLGYPIGRSGVVLQIGPYALLVADACAGLNTLFTLEALGLLYINLVSNASRLRNVLVALAGIPISFTANVTRVCVLALITYYLGDEAGQGFLHTFAGMFMFIVALMLMIAVDTLIQKTVLAGRRERRGEQT